MLQRATIVGLVGLHVICASSGANADVLGDTLDAANTFESVDVTGGTETIFQVSSATVVDPGVELSAFATIHDIDFSDDSLTMTLASNAGLSTTLFGTGVFDRYYFGFESLRVIEAIEVAGDPELIAGLEIRVLEPGFELDVADLFATGITVPREFPNGAFVVELGPGTDYGTLGTSLTIDITTVPEPTSGLLLCGLSCLTAIRSRR